MKSLRIEKFYKVLLRGCFFNFHNYYLCPKIEGFGKVLDKETNSPLPGATIVIKDSSNGVTSDFDGNFKIKSSLGDVLVVSYIDIIQLKLLL